jgi:hypothetical protein
VNPENIWINSAITIGAIVFTFLIILSFMKVDSREGKDWKKEKPTLKNFGAFIANHSLSIGVVSTIIGLSLLVPTFLIGSEGLYWFEWQKEIARYFAPFNIHFFLISLPFLMLGVILINRQPKIKLIKNRFIRLNGVYSFAILAMIGIISLVSGVYSFIVMQAPFLRDIPSYIDVETKLWIHGTYRGEIRFSFFILGILFSMLGFAVIGFCIHHYRHSTN